MSFVDESSHHLPFRVKSKGPVHPVSRQYSRILTQYDARPANADAGELRGKDWHLVVPLPASRHAARRILKPHVRCVSPRSRERGAGPMLS